MAESLLRSKLQTGEAGHAELKTLRDGFYNPSKLEIRKAKTQVEPLDRIKVLYKYAVKQLGERGKLSFVG